LDVVVVHSTSRLTRRVRELLDFISVLDEHNVRLRSCTTGDADVSTADGRQILTILGAMDTAEAERTSARIRAKHNELAENGRYVGPRPFGWDVLGRGADARLVVNPSEAAIVNQCVDRVLAGESVRGITTGLNSQGVTTSKGGTWKSHVQRRMLHREMNIGVRVHQPFKNGKSFGPATRHDGQWDGIIDPDRFLRLKSILTDPRRKTNNRGTEPRFLLTSIAKCGVCGGPLAGAKEYSFTVNGFLRKDGTRSPSKTRIYRASYRCVDSACMGVHRSMADVDDLVTEGVLFVLERDGVQIFGGNEAAAKAARDKAETLRARLDIAADQYADGIIDSDQLARISQKLRPEVAAEEARFAAAQPSPAMSQFTGAGVYEAWEAASIVTRKAVIAQTGVIITVLPIGPGNGGVFDESRVDITWVDEPHPR